MAHAMASVLHVDNDPVGSSPVSLDPILLNSANIFPKMVNQIDKSGWELWQFDACSESHHQAVTISFYRDARTIDKGGFRVDVNAIWDDGTKWGQSIIFAESAITSSGLGTPGGFFHGVWQSKTQSISFRIDEDLSAATIQLMVPGRVMGIIHLRSAALDGHTGLPTTEKEATLGPDVFYIFPMGPTRCSTILTFTSEDGTSNKTSERILNIKTDSGAGGMVRGWSCLSFPNIFADAYYLNATVGPHHLQLIRILSPAASGHKTHSIARLYRDGELLCAAQDTQGLENHSRPLDQLSSTVSGDVLVSKVQDTDDERLRGEFRDKNVGYTIKLTRQEGREWHFETRHRLAWWSDPTSAAGTQGPGKSGFLETVIDHATVDSQVRGIGLAGQLELPDLPAP